MEWVETTGRTVQEAKEKALDELGVDEADAEFEVIAEAQTGLFGRLRSEARVRARVRPSAPRAKEDRRARDRKRRSAAATQQPNTPPADEPKGDPAAAAEPDRTEPDRSAANTSADSPAGTLNPAGTDVPDEGDARPNDDAASRNRNRNRRRRGGGRPGEVPTGAERAQAERGEPTATGDRFGDEDEPAKGTEVEVDLERQAEVAVDFLTKLSAEFGLEATLNLARPDEDTVEVQLTGPDLGILIGPKGATLVAVQNLTRTVVFNETGGSNGHINVDVAGYRQKRTEALVRFAEQAADHVKSSGQRTALEPMSAVDRKIVHDTIANIDGVNTVSEGEEPRRRVVVLPG